MFILTQFALQPHGTSLSALPSRTLVTSPWPSWIDQTCRFSFREGTHLQAPAEPLVFCISLSIFLTDLRGRSGFFFISKQVFNTSLLVLPWRSNDFENFVEILLQLVIDQHQYVQMWPSVNSDLGNGPFFVEISDAKAVVPLAQTRLG